MMSDDRLITLVQDTLIRTVSLIGGTVRACQQSDRELAEALEDAKAYRDREAAAIDQQLAQRVAATEQQYEAAMKQALTKWQAQFDLFTEQADEQRALILDERETIRTKAAKAAKDARWDTESEYETHIDDAEQRLERITKQLEEARWRCTDVFEKSAGWRKTLGMPVQEPPTESEDSHSQTQASAQDVNARLNQADKCLSRVRASGRQRLWHCVSQAAGLIVPLGAGVGIGFLTERPVPGIAGGVLVGVLVLIAMRLRVRRSRRQLILAGEDLAVEALTLAAQRYHDATSHHQSIESTSRYARDHKHQMTREELAQRIELAAPRALRRLEKLESTLQNAIDTAKSKRASAEEDATSAKDAANADSSTQAEAEHMALDETTKATIKTATSRHEAAWSDAISQWDETQAHIQDDLKRISTLQSRLAPNWPSWDTDWKSQQLPTTFVGDIGIGRVRCNVTSLPSGLPVDPRLVWTGPEQLEFPASVDFQGRGSLLIEANEQSRGEGLAIMQALVARVLTTIPPSQVRLTLYDPIGLGQSFAGFMHMADSDDTSILDRVWTEPRHIERKLDDITEHMETVIQAYLRNEYESLEAYNRAAGEIAEPYHLLVLADFPEGITENAAKRLASVLTSGPRCGVFACLLADSSKKMPPPLQDLDWGAARVRLTRDSDQWQITEPALGDFEFIPDQPPADTTLTAIVQRVGEVASGAHRVEVPFALIAPTAEERWTRSSTDELRVTLGQSGANRFQEIRLGRGTTQHALVAGRTGSGKSTLLHVLITNMALWYSPEELEFHLIDFKKGVEFQTYAIHALPHARVVAIESDREFGLSVLRRLDEELRRRGDLFRDAGVQDVAGWRSHSDVPMPRVLLIVDEFQEFFVDDDALAQESGLLLDRLVRQGRAFGVHVLMGSQTLDGAFSLARSSLGQMGVRIALQCAEADSYLILSDENPAARLLRRPGEAIYNDAGGKIEGNSPFQVVWLDDTERDAALDAVTALDTARFPNATRDQFVFKGNIPSLLHTDGGVEDLLAATAWPAPSPLDLALGDPIAIKSQTTLSLRARTGCNTLLVGQHPESGNALLTGCLLQAAAMLPPTTAPDRPGLMVWVFDGTPTDALFAGRLTQFGAALPHQITRVTSKNIEIEMQRLSDILASRADEHAGHATILILGLHPHRLNAMRAAEDDFSYSAEEATSKPDAQFAEILREGPIVGMHSVLWFDGLNNLNRCLSRANQRECDLKVLFQMSANDSGQLIDTTAAADLGTNRALLHIDDVGTIEKFRPWAMPDDRWLAEVAARLSGRDSGS